MQITVDLLLCAAEDRDWAMRIVPVLKEVFSIQDQASSQREPHALWAYKKRGFRDESKQFNPDDADIEDLVGVKVYDLNQLAAVQSPFQRIDIFELVNQKYTYEHTGFLGFLWRAWAPQSWGLSNGPCSLAGSRHTKQALWRTSLS